MANLVVVGTQWGDEGKGKLIDILAEFADIVVRFQGGANAGHTLLVDGEQIITHLVPSGFLRQGKKVAIGPGVVLDPGTLVEEIDDLQARGLLSDPSALLISPRAHVVMPYHKMLDAARETSKGTEKIGTTLRGIGPCMEDKVSRSGIRIGELVDPEILGERITSRLPEMNALLSLYGHEQVKEKDILPELNTLAARLSPFVADVGAVIRSSMDRGRSVLFEGAQGTMLDIDHGTYPFVTSSNTLAAAACTSIGFGADRIDAVVGVAKAYCTRVGAGPFPTELSDDRGLQIREAGGEFGATTGRPRRCGWLDLMALRHALAINGCTSLCLTKLDVLGGMDSIRIAVGYKKDGKEVEEFPSSTGSLAGVEPVYEEVEGWQEDITGIRDMEELPAKARAYIERLETLLNLPVDIVSVGASRSDTIISQNPFRRV